MPRTARLEIPGAIHHVTQRGNNRVCIFRDPVDRNVFLRLLTEASSKHGIDLLSYCLMGNHFHLVVETPEATLGKAMKVLGSRYAQFFNERHETGGGHLYQARYHNEIVRSDEQFAQLLRYVARNPVAAGLCAGPELWPWSSHRVLVANRRHELVNAARVDELLGVWGGPPSSRYVRLFDEVGPLAHIDPDVSPWDMRPPLAELVDSHSGPRAIRQAREYGYRLREIAEQTGLSEATISRRARRAG